MTTDTGAQAGVTAELIAAGMMRSATHDFLYHLRTSGGSRVLAKDRRKINHAVDRWRESQDEETSDVMARVQRFVEAFDRWNGYSFGEESLEWMAMIEARIAFDLPEVRRFQGKAIAVPQGGERSTATRGSRGCIDYSEAATQ